MKLFMHKLVAKVVHQTLLTVQARKEPKTSFRRKDCPTVPGTGGGSTSIEIGTDTSYARMIVTGGRGGSSGLNAVVDRGSFGGGQIGGSCTYKATLQSQGAGIQIDSTCDCEKDRTGKEILENLVYITQENTAILAIQVEEVAMKEDMDVAVILQVEEEAQAGHLLSQASESGRKITLRMHLRMF